MQRATPAAATANPGEVPLPGASGRIGQYEIIRELGRGGMGAVYIARDTRLDRRVAINLMLTDRACLTVRVVLDSQTTVRCQQGAPITRFFGTPMAAGRTEPLRPRSARPELSANALRVSCAPADAMYGDSNGCGSFRTKGMAGISVG